MHELVNKEAPFPVPVDYPPHFAQVVKSAAECSAQG